MHSEAVRKPWANSKSQAGSEQYIGKTSIVHWRAKKYIGDGILQENNIKKPLALRGQWAVLAVIYIYIYTYIHT